MYKNIILITLMLLMLTGCYGIQKEIKEQNAENIINVYYQAIINEDYEIAFSKLYLYDNDAYEKNNYPGYGTILTNKEAKEVYLKKIEYLKKQNYKLKDFEIVEVEYEDGHSFWHHIKLEVELNGKQFEWEEVALLHKGKLLIGMKDDIYANYRDGKMNVDLDI